MRFNIKFSTSWETLRLITKTRWLLWLLPVASGKATVCSQSRAGVVVSNPTVGGGVVCCQVEVAE